MTVTRPNLKRGSFFGRAKPRFWLTRLFSSADRAGGTPSIAVVGSTAMRRIAVTDGSVSRSSITSVTSIHVAGQPRLEERGGVIPGRRHKSYLLLSGRHQ